MDDKDDIDDEDDDKPSFSSNMSGPPSLARRVGNMTGSTSVAYLSPMDRMDSKELLFSLLFTTSTDQPSSRFSSSVGRHATPYDDPDEYFSTPTSLPPPPTVKATSEGHSQPKEEETVRDLEIKIEELQARLVEKKMLEKKEQLPSSVNNSVQGRSSDSSDNNDYDTIVKVERSNSNEGQEEWKKPSEKAGDSRDVVIENNVHAPFISANAKEVPISKLLKKDSFNKIKFNQEDFLNSILSSPQTSVKRVSEGEGTGACKIPPHAKKHGIGISNKDMQPIPKQIADGVIKDFKSAGRFEEGIGRNVDSGWETIEEGVFENKFLETDIPQEVVEIALPPDPNIPHTRSRRTEGYDYTEQNSFDFDRMNPIDSKSNSVDNFQNENIPGKTLSTNENCPDSRNQSMYSKESVEYSDLPPLKYPDHSPINPPSTAGDGQNPLLSNLSNEKSGHSTQLPPKKKSQEMTSLSGNSSLHTVPRYASYMSSLQSLSDHHGFVIKDVTPDGNCMFSAIVDQLRIQGNFDLTPNSLRKTAVEYLRANPKNQDGTHLESFLSTETWLEYLNRMGQESQWGDHMVLQACTEVTGQRIVVFKPNTNKTVLVPTAEESLENTSLTLGHIGESHFVSLRPKDWETNWPLMAHAHRAKMKEKQKLARKKIREIKKSKKQKKTPEPTVSNKEDSTSADEKGKETGSEKGETGSEKAKEAGSEKGKETGSEKGETGSGTGETESGTGETESGTGETGSGTGETESGTEVTETEGATQEVVKEKEPDKDEDDDSDEEEVESDDSQFKTTDECFALVKNREAFDSRSEMPLYHMSFIIQTLVREENMLPDLGGIKERAQNRGHVCRNFIGSRAEKLKVCLQHLNGDNSMGIDCCTKGYLSLCEYRSVVIRNNILAVPSAEEARDVDFVMIETEPIRPGYLRLQTLCPQSHKGQTYWVNETTALLKHTRAKQTEYKGDIVHKGIKSRDWPEAAAEWVSRDRPSGWPGQHVIESAVEGGCLVISRSHALSHKREVEWQLVFPHVETVLAKEALTAAQRYCLCVFKILVDFHLRQISIRLRTTTFKTIVYFACEVLPIDVWERNASGCLMYLLDKLYFHLSKKWLPNYFIKSNNMYDHLSNFEPLAQVIDDIRTYPIMATFFLADHHDLVQIWMFDDIIDDIKSYRNHRDARRSFHNVLLPNLLKLAQTYMLNEWYPTAGTVLNAAYQEILAVAEEHEDVPTFQDFLKKVLATEDIDDRKYMYLYMDRQYGTKLRKTEGTAVQMTTFKDIEGIGDLEQFRDEPIPKSCIGDTVLQMLYILPLAERLEKKNRFSDAICLLQSIIKKARLFKEGFMVPDIIDDPTLEREIIKQTEMPRTLVNVSLMVSYEVLFKCLSSLHEEDKFKQHIQDYEDICYELEHYEALKEVADIWESFGDNERAKTLREEVTRCKHEKTEKIAKTVVSILSGSAGTGLNAFLRNSFP
ncbi:uncharacterized protein LOC110455144 isoform X5 [Mizuhopecten yessoensis]|uniref:uncharacterized protein LOC110455144 isoform X5 n=1 Tax=Mizuhopecten yessoensis TaxID=6573 RepID=UPI000B4579B5|nr:uncharacterized protein LOC110455144 isoform X5 [Mizuhopecten yessoensis]